MATLTDPAKELASICKRFAVGTSVKGATFLGDQFSFAPWSTDFYRVIVSMLRRADQISEIISQSNMDDEHKEMAVAAIEDFKTIFTQSSMNQEWNAPGGGMTIAQKNLQGITFLSHTVRTYIQYPELNKEEGDDIIEEIIEYIRLLDNSNDELPFVRSAIKESLNEFIFRISNLGWFGADYTFAALRDITNAYYALERELSNNDSAQPIYEGLKSVLRDINSKLSTARGWKGNFDLAIGAYKVAASFAFPLVASGMVPSLPALPSP